MARKPRGPETPSGPPEGPPPIPPYDRDGLVSVDVRLHPDRSLAFRLPGKGATWTGSYPDIGALSAALVGLVPPPLRITYVTAATDAA